MRLFMLVAIAVVAVSGIIFAGESKGLADGMRYCPAPWCDNSDFENSYFAIDASTGKMYKLSGNGINSEEDMGTAVAQEEVLYVAPPISVQNIYVPNPDVRQRPQYRLPAQTGRTAVAVQPIRSVAPPARRQVPITR